MVLKLYGVPPSQPTRAVMWLLIMNDIEFEFVKIMPNKSLIRKKYPEYLEMSPMGKVPTIKDENITLYESPAIMTYICSKHNLEHLYPSSTDLVRRAKIDSYLHWHHENVRPITFGFLGYLLRPGDRVITDVISTYQRAAYKGMKVLNNTLSKHKYIVDDKLSIGDILAHEEIIQLIKWPEVGVSVKDKYPNIYRWVNDMKQVKGYEKAHKILGKLDSFIKSRIKATKDIRSKL